jgi:hypothetical protein
LAAGAGSKSWYAGWQRRSEPSEQQPAVIAKNSKAPHRFPRRGAFGAFYLVYEVTSAREGEKREEILNFNNAYCIYNGRTGSRRIR